MKKSAIASIVFLFAIFLAHGQPMKEETKKEQKKERIALKTLEGANVSESAKNSFNAGFGDQTNVHWKRTGTFDEAVFTMDGKEMTAFYDIEGRLVGTTKPASFSDLPANGQLDIKTKYKGYSIGPVIFFDDNEANPTDMVMYGTQFDDSDTYLVELAKGTNKIVVQVDKRGMVSFFRQL